MQWTEQRLRGCRAMCCLTWNLMGAFLAQELFSFRQIFDKVRHVWWTLDTFNKDSTYSITIQRIVIISDICNKDSNNILWVIDEYWMNIRHIRQWFDKYLTCSTQHLQRFDNHTRRIFDIVDKDATKLRQRSDTYLPKIHEFPYYAVNKIMTYDHGVGLEGQLISPRRQAPGLQGP